MTADGNAGKTLREMAAGYRMSQLVFLAARLGLADLLAAGPRSAVELAEATGTRAAPLYRVLRGMGGIGLFEETPDGRFGLTELSQVLRTDHPDSARDNVLFTASEENTRAWGALEHTLRTGVSGFEHAFGMPRFAHLQAHPEWAGVFQSQMSLQMSHVARAVVAAYDFSGVRLVADIGGGRGTLLAALLGAYPDLRAILFDLPEVVAEAEQRLRQAGVWERCRLVGGDFFESVPSDADLYVLSWILHDWPDNQAARILDVCALHVRQGARLLLIERVLPERADNSAATREALLGDVHMLAVLNGRERTRSEFSALLASAGFALERVITTSSPRAILEAVRQ
jgi:hypothetical protein